MALYSHRPCCSIRCHLGAMPVLTRVWSHEHHDAVLGVLLAGISATNAKSVWLAARYHSCTVLGAVPAADSGIEFGVNSGGISVPALASSQPSSGIEFGVGSGGISVPAWASSGTQSRPRIRRRFGGISVLAWSSTRPQFRPRIGSRLGRQLVTGLVVLSAAISATNSEVGSAPPRYRPGNHLGRRLARHLGHRLAHLRRRYPHTVLSPAMGKQPSTPSWRQMLRIKSTALCPWTSPY